MICRASLRSETHAYKARRLLAANGYSCEIIRTTGQREGCSFVLRINGYCDGARRLLTREGIPVQDFRIERGSP